MNKKTLLPLVFVPLAATNLQAQSNMQIEHADKRPNIILFMVDDMGWQDTSLPFWTQKTHYNELYETPNMERLAKQGMMFTQAYASSISSPSRCSLITGTNAARHRVTNWTLQKNTMTDRKDSILAVPDWNYNGVSQVSGTNNTFVGTSFVQILKNNGYHTIHCGKAHFGAIDTPGEDPHHWGFEVNIAGHAAGGLASYLGEENYGHTKDGKAVSLMSVPGLEKYWGTETFVTEGDYERVRCAIAALMGEKDDYLDVFLDDMAYSDTPIKQNISENLADIYQPLKDFICVYQLGFDQTMNDALVICREHFAEFWGQRLVNVMRALHEVRYSKQTDTDEEAEDDAYASSPFAEDEGYSEDDLYEGLEAGEDDGLGDRWE